MEQNEFLPGKRNLQQNIYVAERNLGTGTQSPHHAVSPTHYYRIGSAARLNSLCRPNVSLSRRLVRVVWHLTPSASRASRCAVDFGTVCYPITVYHRLQHLPNATMKAAP